MTKEFKKIAGNDRFILYAIKIKEDTLEVERSYFKNFKYITIWYQDLLFLYAENYKLYIITPRGEKILMPGSFKNFLITPEIQKLRFENPDSYTVSLFLAFHNDVLPTDTDLFITNVANAIYNRDSSNILSSIKSILDKYFKPTVDTYGDKSIRTIERLYIERQFFHYTIDAGASQAILIEPLRYTSRGKILVGDENLKTLDAIKIGFCDETDTNFVLAYDVEKTNTPYAVYRGCIYAKYIVIELDNSSGTERKEVSIAIYYP